MCKVIGLSTEEAYIFLYVHSSKETNLRLNFCFSYQTCTTHNYYSQIFELMASLPLSWLWLRSFSNLPNSSANLGVSSVSTVWIPTTLSSSSSGTTLIWPLNYCHSIPSGTVSALQSTFTQSTGHSVASMSLRVSTVLNAVSWGWRVEHFSLHVCWGLSPASILVLFLVCIVPFAFPLPYSWPLSHRYLYSDCLFCVYFSKIFSYILLVHCSCTCGHPF